MATFTWQLLSCCWVPTPLKCIAAGEYFIVKNSWGPTWGDQGYIKLAMGATQGQPGMCGIAMQARTSYVCFVVRSVMLCCSVVLCCSDKTPMRRLCLSGKDASLGSWT